MGGYPDKTQDLIITADGNPDFFDQAESLVAEAPELKHWNIIALKPPVEGGVIESNGIQLSPEKMWFIPLSSKKSPKIGLRLYIDNYNSDEKDNFLFASYLLIDNLLGEKSSGLDIGHVEIENLPPISQQDDLIELSKLPRYVKWHKNKAIA